MPVFHTLMLVILYLLLFVEAGLILFHKRPRKASPRQRTILNALGALLVLAGLLAILAGEGLYLYPPHPLTTLDRWFAGLTLSFGTFLFFGSLLDQLWQQKRNGLTDWPLRHHLAMLIGSLVLAQACFILRAAPRKTGWISPGLLLGLGVLFSAAGGCLFVLRLGQAPRAYRQMQLVISGSLSALAMSMIGISAGTFALSLLVTGIALLGSHLMLRDLHRYWLDMLLARKRPKIRRRNRAQNKRVRRWFARHQESRDAAILWLSEANHLVIIPGYGLVVAQAEQLLADLVQQLAQSGRQVHVALHPQAGRLPHHLTRVLETTTLLPDQLVDVAQGNALLKEADLALVLGASDIINTARAEQQPEMLPILQPDKAKKMLWIATNRHNGYSGMPVSFDRERTLRWAAPLGPALNALIRSLCEGEAHSL